MTYSAFCMGSFGQVSLEYLLLLLCIFSIFVLLLPLLSSVFALCVFGLDAANAKNFSVSLEQAVWEASFQGSGSVSVVRARPVGDWVVYSSGRVLFVEVSGPGSLKVFSVEFPNSLGFFRKSFSGESLFLVRNEHGRVLFEDYDD